jgi:hypothetical protein
VSRAVADPIAAFESVGELALGLLALSLVGSLGLSAPLAALAVLALWLAIRRRDRIPPGVRRRLRWVALGVVVLALGVCLRTMVSNLAYPAPGSGGSEWDFLAFWIDGRAGVSGRDFYDPSSYHVLSLPFVPSAAFRASILDVGFRYPPSTMLLFAPLGWLDYSTAYALWDVATLLALGGCAWLIQRIWLRDYGGWGVVLGLLMLLVMPASLATIRLGQSNFFALLAVLLALRNEGRFRGGAYLVLAALVKPLLAVLALPLLVMRRWRTLLGGAVALAARTVATGLAFGPLIFSSYAATLPSRMPHSSYVEEVRQSLLAVVLRATGDTSGVPAANPFFLALAALLLSATVWAMVHARRRRPRLIWGTWIVLAMLLFPGTLRHYAVLLLVPWLAIWEERRSHPFGLELLALSTVAVFLGAAAPGTNAVFEASLACWLACVAALAIPGAVLPEQERAADPAPAAPPDPSAILRPADTERGPVPLADLLSGR